jgi:hypothetical protein
MDISIWPPDDTDFIITYEDGPDGKFLQYENFSNDEYLARWNATFPSDWTEQQNPEKVYFVFDLSCGPEENVGTNLRIDFSKDWTDGKHYYIYPIEHTGWKTVKIKLSDVLPTGHWNGENPIDFNLWDFRIVGAGSRASTIIQLDNIKLVEELETGIVIPLSPEKVNVYLAANELVIKDAQTIRGISLYDLRGQRLLQTAPASQEAVIQLNKYPAGIYIVQIIDETGITVKKIIKK